MLITPQMMGSSYGGEYMDDIYKKQKDVKKILLTPIELGEEKSFENNCIFTKQTYKVSPDPDMSAVAVGFYEIIYGLKILDGEGNLLNEEFAGDTMCSFNTIANSISAAGKSKTQRTSIEDWPVYLRDYYYQYHCLANFWLLPMEVGRTNPANKLALKGLSKSTVCKDYMDRFLEYYSKNPRRYESRYPSYVLKFGTDIDFYNKHFLLGMNNYADVINGKIVITKLTLKNNPEQTIKNMTMAIEARADAISKSKYCNELWDYFSTLGLCK